VEDPKDKNNRQGRRRRARRCSSSIDPSHVVNVNPIDSNDWVNIFDAFVVGISQVSIIYPSWLTYFTIILTYIHHWLSVEIYIKEIKQ
jgi:hypothetical protein